MKALVKGRRKKRKIHLSAPFLPSPVASRSSTWEGRGGGGRFRCSQVSPVAMFIMFLCVAQKGSPVFGSSCLSLTDMADLVSVLACIVFLAGESWVCLQRLQLGDLLFCIRLRACRLALPIEGGAGCLLRRVSCTYGGRLLHLRWQL